VTLVVVVIALLLVSIALPIPGPRRDIAASERRFIEVRLALTEMRALLDDFRSDHGFWPGQGLDGRGDPRLLSDQIAHPTGADGHVLAADGTGTRHERARGPYRKGGVPANPINGLTSVRFLRIDEPWPEDGDGATGWLYRPATGEIRVNLSGRAFPTAPPYLDL
jgi:type II secretory pathway pseudopilin PulG